MAQQTLNLNNNPADPLTLNWGFNWRNFQVLYQGELLGEIAGKKGLVQGQQFQLPDNRVVSIKLKGSFMPQLEVLLDGEPVSGSATHPAAVVEQVFKLSVILGIFNLGLGLASTFFTVSFLENLGFGPQQILVGALIIGLAFGIRKHSMAALVASMIFWIADYGLSVYLAAQETGGGNPSSGLIMRMIIVFSLYRAMGAMKQLKQMQQAEVQPA